MYNQGKAMETLDLDGKRYIKISSAARDTGYTSDYIGQLCRAKKIDAKLVGRTWYVHEGELRDHQRTRGRSSHEKARKAVKEHITTGIESEVRIPIHIVQGSSPEYRKRLLEQEIRYHRDDSELLPNTTPVHITAVSSDNRDTDHKLAISSEQKLEVENTEESSVLFNTKEKQEIQWNGTIVLQPLEDTTTSLGDSGYKSSATALSTVHLRVKDSEHATKPHVTLTQKVHDPLAVQERFLTRVNKAHDFNEVFEVPLNEKSRQTPKIEERRSARVAPTASPAESIVIPLLAGAGCLVFFLATTLFLQNIIEYVPSTSSSNTAGIFTSKYTLSSVENVKMILLYTISAIRDSM